MPAKRVKAQTPTRDVRNTKVVAALILTMTVGAAILLWLEPAAGVRNDRLLMAARAGNFERGLIEFATPSDMFDLASVDCLIDAGGTSHWQPSGQLVRVIVRCEPNARLTDAQKRALLDVLGYMHRDGGLEGGRVQLASDSDPEMHANLPPAAKDLRSFLDLKGFIR